MVLSVWSQIWQFTERFFHQSWLFKYFQNTTSGIMASHTESEIACRGKNKVGTHNLRQIGLGPLVAMTYLRRFELKLASSGVVRTAEDIMEDMKHLHSILSFQKGARQPSRRLETLSKTQGEVLSVFGCQIDESGVLQSVTR